MSIKGFDYIPWYILRNRYDGLAARGRADMKGFVHNLLGDTGWTSEGKKLIAIASVITEVPSEIPCDTQCGQNTSPPTVSVDSTIQGKESKKRHTYADVDPQRQTTQSSVIVVVVLGREHQRDGMDACLVFGHQRGRKDGGAKRGKREYSTIQLEDLPINS